MSKQQTFDLMGAKSASERMQILLHFIEFWLGSRRLEYGESAEALAALRLPIPLRVLYEFAGRWPRFYPLPNYEPWNHALAHQLNPMGLAASAFQADAKIGWQSWHSIPLLWRELEMRI
jgi:hypothetical protein